MGVSDSAVGLRRVPSSQSATARRYFFFGSGAGGGGGSGIGNGSVSFSLLSVPSSFAVASATDIFAPASGCRRGSPGSSPAPRRASSPGRPSARLGFVIAEVVGRVVRDDHQPDEQEQRRQRGEHGDVGEALGFGRGGRCWGQPLFLRANGQLQVEVFVTGLTLAVRQSRRLVLVPDRLVQPRVADRDQRQALEAPHGRRAAAPRTVHTGAATSSQWKWIVSWCSTGMICQ